MNTIDKLGIKTTFTKLLDGTLEEYIDDTLEIIFGGYIFANMNDIRNIELPALTTMDGYSFINDYKLERLSIPMVDTINAYCISNCNSLTTLDADNVTSIKDTSVRNCNAIEILDFPRLTSIEYNSLCSCSSLKTINAPNLKTIGQYCIMNCQSLTAFNCPNLISIGYNAFSNTPLLQSESINVDSVVTISDFMMRKPRRLWKWKKLTHITGSNAIDSNTRYVDFHMLEEIYSGSIYIYGNQSFKAFIIRTPQICKWTYLSENYGFNTSNPLAIYVPLALLTEYQTNREYSWYHYADYIHPIEGSPFEDPDWREEDLE